MYTVIGTARSRAMRVLWMLEELEQPYEHVPAAPRSPEALAASPTGKVPALRDGGEVLTDSVAIMTFLADRHGALTHPAGTHARARQDAATHLVLDEFDAVLWAAARHSFVLPEERRVPAVKETLRWEIARAGERLERMLGDAPFLAGDTITVPDILAVHCLGWASAAKMDPGSARLAEWAAGLRERPAFGRASARAG